MAGWENFFIAVAGAAAALTGLIFVGVSINLSRILSLPTLPGRALLSLVLLITILLISCLCLVPGQPDKLLGSEVLVMGIAVWIFATMMDLQIYRGKEKSFKRVYLFNAVVNQLAIIPYSICGITILCNSESGFYWIVPAMLLSFVKSILDAWVLLVEINR